MEQEEYTKEEIDWSYIEFVDNQDVLDLLEKVIFLMSCVSPISRLHCMFLASCDIFPDNYYSFLMQKPGGIVSLLDEAW